MLQQPKMARWIASILCISVAIPIKSALLSPPREKGRPVVN
jgi:hypothetical protein